MEPSPPRALSWISFLSLEHPFYRIHGQSQQPCHPMVQAALLRFSCWTTYLAHGGCFFQTSSDLSRASLHTPHTSVFAMRVPEDPLQPLSQEVCGVVSLSLKELPHRSHCLSLSYGCCFHGVLIYGARVSLVARLCSHVSSYKDLYKIEFRTLPFAQIGFHRHHSSWAWHSPYHPRYRRRGVG